MDFKTIYKRESYGMFDFGIEIRISAPIAESEGISLATYKAADLIKEAVVRDFYANNKEAQEYAAHIQEEILNCFAGRQIFVRAIPNGYCHMACCEYLPWYKVTTSIGDITIGWRKRVIVIDWSESVVTVKAEELFLKEDVTKYERLIHAWSYEKSREYIDALFKAVE